jgi:hypothetical protein
MVKRKAIFFVPLAIAAALPGTWAVSAAATGTSNGGSVTLYQVDTTLSPQGSTPAQLESDSVTLTGALADYGVDSEAVNGTNFNVLELQNGDIAIDLSEFGSGTQPTPSENPSNCSYTQVTVGPVFIVQNELRKLATPLHPFSPGMYRNLQGTFNVTATFAGVVPRINVAGTNQCDFSQMGNTPTGLDFVNATADVTFSG